MPEGLLNQIRTKTTSAGLIISSEKRSEFAGLSLLGFGLFHFVP